MGGWVDGWMVSGGWKEGWMDRWFGNSTMGDDRVTWEISVEIKSVEKSKMVRKQN